MSWGYSKEIKCDKCNKLYNIQVGTLEKAKNEYDKRSYCKECANKLVTDNNKIIER